MKRAEVSAHLAWLPSKPLADLHWCLSDRWRSVGPDGDSAQVTGSRCVLKDPHLPSKDPPTQGSQVLSGRFSIALDSLYDANKGIFVPNRNAERKVRL